MKLKELNEELIGKRVNCVYQGRRTGIIVALVEKRDPYNHQVCARGVKIRFDEPVFQHTGCEAFGTACEWWQEEYESTCRVISEDFAQKVEERYGKEELQRMIESNEKGCNLQYTEVIEEAV